MEKSKELKKLELLILIFFLSFNHAIANPGKTTSIKKVNIKIIYNDKVYENIDLLLINGMGYLKISDISNILKARTYRKKGSKGVVFSLKNKNIKLFIDNSTVIIDGVHRKMNKITRLINDEIWIPLELIITRAFSEFSKLGICWDYPKKTLSFSQKRRALQKPATISKPRVISKIPKKIKIIVIDPGHGGKDPGAIGPRGTKEKDVVLYIARRLSKELRRKLKVKVYLTRNDDRFIHLAERTAFAKKKKADLFISIHANASLNPKSKGFEVYFLSKKASDRGAQAVANLENSVLVLEDEGKSDELNKILWSLTVDQFINESSKLCGLINKEVPKLTGLETRGVKQANFYVLRGASMPAILVETAFISNSAEEKKLRSRRFRKKIVNAICQGIKNY